MVVGKDEAKRTGRPDGSADPELASRRPREPSSAGEQSAAREGDKTTAGESAPLQSEAATLTELRSENAALKDRLLRALAETENVRRRAERDLDDARQYAVTKFARDLLPVADNMQRAMASVGKEAHRGEALVKALVEGVDLTEKELLNVLAKHGVKKLSPIGERFDPHLHEALFEAADPSLPTGTVSTVVSPGYVIGSRPLRAAQVGVARGGPPAEPDRKDDA